jgi:enterochelin esterase-like enzyme
MPPLPKHPLGWNYIYLRLLAFLIRSSSATAQLIASVKHKIPEGVILKHITIPSRDKGRDIKVHVYEPVGYDSTKPTPVLVNWHGSVNFPNYCIQKLEAYSINYGRLDVAQDS